MADTRYLFLRHHTWSVALDIPKGARGPLGRKRFVRSLRTHDLREAQRLRWQYISEWQRRIAAALSGDPVQRVMEEALDRADDLQRSHGEVREMVESDILDRAKEVLARHGFEVSERFVRVAKGEAVFLRDLLPTWLDDIKQSVSSQTLAMREAHLQAFLGWLGDAATATEVDRRRAGEYLSSLRRRLARNTVSSHKSSLSLYWEWLEAREMVNGNPWARHKLPKDRRRTPRRPWTDDDLVRLLTASGTPEYGQILQDIVRMALATGARLEEICALKTEHVIKREDGWWMRIEKGKTEAARREVPLVDWIVPVVERRLAEADEHLFKGLRPGGPDKKRSWYVSKAFGRWCDTLGLSDPGLVFHSLRNTFIEALEAVGVPESTTKLLVGHKRSSLTYGGYSRGMRLDLRAVISLLDYGPRVMPLLRQLGAKADGN